MKNPQKGRLESLSAGKCAGGSKASKLLLDPLVAHLRGEVARPAGNTTLPFWR